MKKGDYFTLGNDSYVYGSRCDAPNEHLHQVSLLWNGDICVLNDTELSNAVLNRVGTGSISLQVRNSLNANWTEYDPIFQLKTHQVKCECGADKVGSTSHSSWCGKHGTGGLV